MGKKQTWRAAAYPSNEHELEVGRLYRFTDRQSGTVEVGKLLYLFTRRVYKTDDDGNINVNDYKVIHFRCGYEPIPRVPGVFSRHLELGWFTIDEDTSLAAAMYETAEGLGRIGLLDEAEMHEYEQLLQKDVEGKRKPAG